MGTDRSANCIQPRFHRPSFSVRLLQNRLCILTANLLPQEFIEAKESYYDEEAVPKDILRDHKEMDEREARDPDSQNERDGASGQRDLRGDLMLTVGDDPIIF
jgi:hypothetical protein